METTESRIIRTPSYPKIVYLESLILFFGANYLYHRSVFTHNSNKPQFLGFILVNLFTSY